MTGTVTTGTPVRSLGRPVCRTGAIVIGGNYRGLGIVRSLGRRGIPVWVLKDEHWIASASRYACHSEGWPASSETDQRDYLLDLGTRYQLDGWAIFPTTDESAAMVARHYSALAERFRLTTPGWDVMCWAYDKRLTYRLAGELQIDHPSTCYPTSRTAVEQLDCDYPVILKPAIKVQANRFTIEKAWQINDRQSLLRRYDEARELVEPGVIMVQEMIPGNGESQFSYAALCEEGRPLASLVARRARQYPLDFGRASTYVETVDQPDVERLAQRLLAAMAYTGLVEVEFKRDPRDGRFKLLDVNARVWGWHTLGRRAGLDFPYLTWMFVQGDPIPGTRARPGVRWVRLATDFPSAMLAIRSGSLTPWGYLRSLRQPLEFAIFATDDPLPALIDVPWLAYLLWKRRDV
jgi:predicted ATP-grasp superfamily ATP-dependent carboligase